MFIFLYRYVTLLVYILIVLLCPYLCLLAKIREYFPMTIKKEREFYLREIWVIFGLSLSFEFRNPVLPF